jgi:putative intracellular protease/amidase
MKNFFKISVSVFLSIFVITASLSAIEIKQMKSENKKAKKILMVVANPAIASTTGWPVGFWASELTHSYYEFINAGYEVTVASPKGGKVEFDAYSDPRDKSGYSKKDILSLGYTYSGEFMALLANTPKISDLKCGDYDAIVVAGGQAPMFTFKNETGLQKIFVEFYESKKITAALCHGTSLLLYARLSNGKLLVTGKTVTGFTNEEEDYVDKAMGIKVMPFRIEDEIKKAGGKFIKNAPLAPYAVRDGNLITGQQQNSGRFVAELVIKSLER